MYAYCNAPVVKKKFIYFFKFIFKVSSLNKKSLTSFR